MLRYLPLVLRNATRNRRRSILTILSIGASLCLLGVLLSLYHVFFLRDPGEGQSLRLVTRNRISLANIMPISYREKIAGVPGVDEVMVFQYFGGVYKDARELKNMFARFGVEPDKLFKIFPEFQISEEEKRAFQRERTACIVGKPLAERMGMKIGDRVVIQGDIFPMNLELTVRGIYDAPENNEGLYFNDEYLREADLQGYRDIASLFVIKVHSVADMPVVTRAIDEMFRNSQHETKTDTEQAFAISFLSYLGNVKLFLLAVSAALTFTVLLVSANTMAMSVRERVREVGILRSLGFTPGTILGILLSESVVIALAGGVVGLLLANLIITGLRNAPAIFVDLKALHLTPSLAAACLALAAFIGFVSCLIPAMGASRRSIVEAMRFND